MLRAAAIVFYAFVFSASAQDLTIPAKRLAGMPDVSYPQDATASVWKQHQELLSPQWDVLKKQRISVMETWRDVHLPSNTCSTMLYPFSGPDFINAYTLFPNCDEYIFFGLEQPGHLPHVERLNAADLEIMLSNFRIALGTVVARNYFITGEMMTQLHTSHLKGVAPVLVASMAVMGLRVQTIEFLNQPRSTRITFFNDKTNRQQTLTYYSLNATNFELRKSNPGFIPFIKQHKSCHTLLKAASYLLHDPQFTNVRDALLDVSSVVVQDDTGIPYKFLNKGWRVQLYGQYSRPIEDFNYGFQPDLQQAYSSTSPPPLPFSFGYHWRLGNSGLIVARKTRP